MADIIVDKPLGMSTMFGKVREKNITILLDTSGSMDAFLEAAKEHVLEMLLERAFKFKGTMFNLIEFSSDVAPWADKLVRCTPQTVTVAGEWLRTLTCKTSTNTLDALITAFKDPVCEAVYLLTDGLPDQNPESILRCIGKLAKGRAVHSIYLTSPQADTPAYSFLEKLAHYTNGTFRVTCLSQRGNIEKVTTVVQPPILSKTTEIYKLDEVCDDELDKEPLTTIDNPPIREVQTYSGVNPHKGRAYHSAPTTPLSLHQLGQSGKYCSVTTSLDHKPVSRETVYVQPSSRIFTANADISDYGVASWETVRPPPIVKQLVTASVPLYVERGLLQGTKVLARHNKDGFYRPGILSTEVTSHHTCLVSFDRDPKGGNHQTLVQECPLSDVMAYDEGMRQTITPGDKVLAPWEKNAIRRGPGTVLEGIEGRAAGCAADTDFLIVNFFNGKTEKVPKNTAMRISPDFFEQMRQEIQIPMSARRYSTGTPLVWRTGGASPALSNIIEYETVSSIAKGTGLPVYVPVYPDVSNPTVYRMPTLRDSFIKSDQINSYIPGTEITKEELNRKISLQLRGIQSNQSRQFSEESRPCMDGYHGEENIKQKSFDSKNDESGYITSDKIELKDFDYISDSGCEEGEYDIAIDKGVQTLSLENTGIVVESRGSNSDNTTQSQEEWKYFKRTPKESKKGVGPFRPTLMSAPMEPKTQTSLSEPMSTFPTEFNDRDPVKSDRAQTEWIYRQPRPPMSHPRSPVKNHSKNTTSTKGVSTTSHPQNYPGDHVGPQNRSGTFEKVNHQLRRDPYYDIEAYMMQYHQHYVPVMQGPSQSVSDAVGVRDKMRETKMNAQLQNRRERFINREIELKKKELNHGEMRNARDKRQREYAAGIIQREKNREISHQKQIENTLQAKRNLNNNIRQKEETRAEREQEKERLRIEALAKKRERREEIRTQREKEIQDTINRRREIKQQQMEERSAKHVEQLTQQQEQLAARDNQMRDNQLQRREHFRNVEQVNQEKKEMRVAAQMQRLQEYRSQVLP